MGSDGRMDRDTRPITRFTTGIGPVVNNKIIPKCVCNDGDLLREPITTTKSGLLLITLSGSISTSLGFCNLMQNASLNICLKKAAITTEWFQSQLRFVVNLFGWCRDICCQKMN